jgi:serine/threonine protein kinase
MEKTWILNAYVVTEEQREKHFMLFVDEQNKWRRVSVSWSYKTVFPGSLEEKLQQEKQPRQRSATVYEAIRDIIQQITQDERWCDTVTRLKLETGDNGQFDIAVNEDCNEAIPYPSLPVMEPTLEIFKESEVYFDSHVRDFIYIVSANNNMYTMKEIAGPDSVPNFLREMEALVLLRESKHVVSLEAIVVDETEQVIKGLLMTRTGQTLREYIRKSGHTSYESSLGLMRQILQGLVDIHNAEIVYGNLTLDNIYIDDNNNIKLAEFRRSGCPIGWHPPEMIPLIEAGKTIVPLITSKTDIFQLGMVIWALLEQHPEPETLQRPLTLNTHSVDTHILDIVKRCLDDDPQHRPSAKDVQAKLA